MKKLGKLKLNQLSKVEMDKRKLSQLLGGKACGCGCHYSGQPGGSSSYENMNANYELDTYSPGGWHACRHDPGDTSIAFDG